MLKKITNFIQILKHKYLYKKQGSVGNSPQITIQEKLETALLSESSLQKDWLTPVEDEAWKHLWTRKS